MSAAAPTPAEPRLVLVAGPGGSGSTTTAALTALQLAGGQHREVVLVSADPLAADILGDLPDAAAGVRLHQVQPVAAADGESLADLLGSLTAGGAADQDAAVDASELAALPGAAEVALLLAVADEVRRLDAAGTDPGAAVVVDAGSRLPELLQLPETLALLADRLLPAPLRLLRSLRRGGTGARAASAADRLIGRLLAVHAALTDPRLCRLLLVAGGSPLRDRLTRRLELLAAMYGQPARRVSIPRQPTEPVGAALVTLAASCPPLLPGTDGQQPSGAGDAPPGPEAEPARGPDGEWWWTIGLPGAGKDELALSRSGDDILLTVVGHTRRVELPSVLTRCTVLGAQHTDAGLLVRFAPDPAKWPQALLAGDDGHISSRSGNGHGNGATGEAGG